MTRSDARSDIIAVMEANGPRVTIEFDTNAAEQMAGRLLDQHGASVPFDGWLGLASVLERILAPARGPEAAAADRPEVPN